MGSKPPFRAEHVGSLLRPQALKTAFRDFYSGALGKTEFKTIQDNCIRDAVAMQESVGLQSITDGEFRRGSWFLGFVEAVEGLTTKEALFVFHDAGGGEARVGSAYVESKLRRTKPITVDEFLFVKMLTDKTPKVTMPTPSLVHFFRGDDTVNRQAYPDIEQFWSDLVAVYREELSALAEAGCTYVQLDEVPCAMLCDPSVRDAVKAHGLDPEQLLNRYIQVTNDLLAGRPPQMTIAMHLCRGNYKGRWMAAGGYEPVAERLFQQIDVDAFFLEFDTERAGSFEPLRLVPKEKKVVLGLISSKTPKLETTEDIKRRIEAASKYVGLERLAVSPQCGFASSVGGNPLTQDDQKRKLELVVRVADEVWGR